MTFLLDSSKTKIHKTIINNLWRKKEQIQTSIFYWTVRASFMDLYTIRWTIWFIQKYMLIWKICFYFRHIMLCTTYSQKGALAQGQFQLARSFHLHDREGRKWLRTSRSWKNVPNFELQRCREARVQSYYAIGLRELKLFQHESPISVNTSHMTWRVFIYDKQITKIKLKYNQIFHITNTFEYTK